MILISILALTSSAQQISPLSTRAAAVKRKIDTLSLQSPISVVRVHAEEEFGNFKSSDQNGLTFYDVDRKANVTLSYAEVKKIKDGYGGYNSLRHKHTDRTKAMIVGIAVIGALGGLIAAVASAKN
jgi:hypothetical protein